MPITKTDVSLEEAIELAAAMQEAARLDGREFRILDVGGAIKPLIFATHVIDILPYDNRAWFGHIAHVDISPELARASERFNKDTWTSQDICVLPWPYEDDYFDFIWCTQTVEDVRDPLVVLREMSRIGKSGYVQTIDRNFESLKNAEDPRYAGYVHHRWFIEHDAGELKFTQKYPVIHVQPELAPRQTGIKFLSAWWVGDIVGNEHIAMSREAIEDWFKIYNDSLLPEAERQNAQ